MGKLTGEREVAVNGEDTSLSAVVTEFAIGVTREDLSAVAAKKFDVCGGRVFKITERRSCHLRAER